MCWGWRVKALTVFIIKTGRSIFGWMLGLCGGLGVIRVVSWIGLGLILDLGRVLLRDPVWFVTSNNTRTNFVFYGILRG